jgi:hypothetical protein
MDPEVHGFASEDTNVLPLPWRRRQEAFPNNGISNPWFKGQVVAQKGVKDIGEKDMDPEVHGFASEDTNVLPLPWRRRQEAYSNNGISNPWFKGQVVA